MADAGQGRRDGDGDERRDAGQSRTDAGRRPHRRVPAARPAARLPPAVHPGTVPEQAAKKCSRTTSDVITCLQLFGEDSTLPPLAPPPPPPLAEAPPAEAAAPPNAKTGVGRRRPTEATRHAIAQWWNQGLASAAAAAAGSAESAAPPEAAEAADQSCARLHDYSTSPVFQNKVSPSMHSISSFICLHLIDGRIGLHLSVERVC